MASIIPNAAIRHIVKNDIDFDVDDFKCMLLTSSYTPNKDTDEFRDDIEANEVAATGGYSAGGEDVTVTVLAVDNTNDRQEVTLGGISIPTSTITARYGAYYKARGGASSADEIVAVIDFGGNISSTGGTWSLTDSTMRFQNGT